MNLFLARSFNIAVALSVAWIAVLYAWDQATLEATETLLTPWLELCRTATPVAWQTRGNVLLGLAWYGSGVFVYGLCAGLAITALFARAGRCRCADDVSPS